MKNTVSAWINTQNMLQQRYQELIKLRSETSTVKHYYGDTLHDIVPTYDVKMVDKLISELSQAINVIKIAIKDSNSITKIDIEADAKTLLRPIE